ncbi:MAG: hypothetical protein PSY14_06015 [bacterium]|nr:hypothetical protein [bacterium]
MEAPRRRQAEALKKSGSRQAEAAIIFTLQAALKPSPALACYQQGRVKMFGIENIEYLAATRPAFLAGLVFGSIAAVVLVVIPIVKIIGPPVAAVLTAGIEDLF